MRVGHSANDLLGIKGNREVYLSVYLIHIAKSLGGDDPLVVIKERRMRNRDYVYTSCTSEVSYCHQEARWILNSLQAHMGQNKIESFGRAKVLNSRLNNFYSRSFEHLASLSNHRSGCVNPNIACNELRHLQRQISCSNSDLKN